MADKDTEVRQAEGAGGTAPLPVSGSLQPLSKQSTTTFVPYVRIGDKIMTIAEASKPKAVNIVASAARASPMKRTRTNQTNRDAPTAAMQECKPPSALSTTHAVPSAPTFAKPARSDTSTNAARRVVRVRSTAAVQSHADASFLDKRGESIEVTALRRKRFPSFLEKLVELSNGTFTEVMLQEGAFIYLQVHTNLFDVTMISSTDTARVMTNATAAAAGYLTVSAKGVSHIYKDGMEFYPLEKFEADYLRYQRMLSIPFFRLYHPWRIFSAWKRAILRRRYESRQELLERSLFVLTPTLRDSLLHVRALCIHITQLKLFHLDIETRALRDWLELQEHAQNTLQQALGTITSKIRRIVLRAAAVSLDGYMALQGFTSHPLEVVLDEFQTRGEAGPSQMGPSATLARRMAYNTTFATPKDVKYTMRAAARSYCRKLMRFVRLADLSIFGALLQLSCIGTGQLLTFMCAASLQERKARLAGSTKRTFAPSMQAEAGAVFSAELQAKLPPAVELGSMYNVNVRESDSADDVVITAQLLVPPASVTADLQGLYFVPSAETFRSRVDAAVMAGLRIIAQCMTSRLANSDDFRALREAILSRVDGLDEEEEPLPAAKTEAGLLHSSDSDLSGPDDESGDIEHVRVGADNLSSGKMAATIGDMIASATPTAAANDASGKVHGFAATLALLLEDQGVISNLEGISAVITKTFDLADGYARGFQQFRRIAIIDTKLLTVVTRQLLSSMAVVDIYAALDELQKHISLCDTIPTTRDVGLLLRVDTSRLQRQVQPCPRRAYELVSSLLPEASYDNATSLLSEVLACNARLRTEPANVDEYVTLVRAMQEIQDKLSDFIDREEWLRDIRKLFESKSIRVNDETRSMLLSVVETGRHMRDVMSTVEEKQDANTAKFSRELDASIPKLKAAIADARRRSDEFTIHRPSSNPDDVVSYLENLRFDVLQLADRASTIVRYQETLRIPVASFEELTELGADVDAKLALWRCVHDWFAYLEEWLSSHLLAIDIDSVQSKTNSFARNAILSERSLPGSAVVAALRDRISIFSVAIPVLRSVRSPHLRSRHLAQMQDILGFDTREPDLTLQQALKAGLLKFAKQLNQLAFDAAAEHELEESLNRVINRWNEIELQVQPYSYGREAYILSDPAEVEAALDDTLVELNAMMGSRYVAPLKVNVESLQGRLLTLEEILSDLKIVQHHWLFLEPIFIAIDIQRALPSEAKTFSMVDASYRDTIRKIKEDPIALGVASRQGLLDILRRHINSLEGIRSQLEVYLESKRSAFPRFYFLSNDELLDILAHAGSDPRKIQAHLPKLFDAITALTIEEPKSGEPNRGGVDLDLLASATSAPPISAMMSAEGESVPFVKAAVRARGSPEEYLKGVEDAMRSTLKQLIRSGVASLEAAFRVVIDPFEEAITIASRPPSRFRDDKLSSVDASKQPMPSDEALEKLAQDLAETRTAWIMENFHQVMMTAASVAFCRGTEEALRARSVGSSCTIPIADVEASQPNTGRRLSGAAPSPVQYGATLARNAKSAMSPLSGAGDALVSWRSRISTDLIAFSHVVRSPISALQYRAIVTTITLTVHFRDIIDRLIEERSTDADTFSWQMQLRYYLDSESGGINVRHGLASVAYGYEYQGCSPRLVVTPLTERCWLTLTSSYRLKVGAAPAGPAGTGKTESSKDLARGIGIQCIVFNCSEQVDYVMIGRIFSGLAQTGAWACLDEFNRMNIEVLSVVASQLQQLRRGRLANVEKVVFEGKTIPLKEHHVIVTSNPGYAGRTELPDNLKALFRPCCMILPDSQRIAEVIMTAEGFEDAKRLSLKVTQLFKATAAQLSPQQHYDWGMRALKAVLVIAGRYVKSLDAEVVEERALIAALLDCTMPRLAETDQVLFYGLLLDMFPDDGPLDHNPAPAKKSGPSGRRYSTQQTDIDEAERVPSWIYPICDSDVLLSALELSSNLLGLQLSPRLVSRQLQLFATMNVRYGSAIMGAPGSGKTSMCVTLGQAVNVMAARSAVAVAVYNRNMQRASLRRSSIRRDMPSAKAPVLQRGACIHSLNPKSLSLESLYGFVNPVTLEWNDGIASRLLRDAVRSDAYVSLTKANLQDFGVNVEDWRASSEDGAEPLIQFPCDTWIVFDGPIDSVWIESMNSVLDDSMTLCLPSNERIKLPTTLRLIFEVSDLKNASPATISRLGVVNVLKEDASWELLYRSFLDRADFSAFTSTKVRQRLWSYSPILAKCIEFVEQEEGILQVHMSSNTVVSSFCNLLFCLVVRDVRYAQGDTERAVPIAVTASENPLSLSAIDRMFSFAIIWSFGAVITPDRWRFFDAFVRDLFKKSGFESGLGSNGMVFDYYLRNATRQTGATSAVGSQVSFGELMFRGWQELLPVHYDFATAWEEGAERTGRGEVGRVSDLFVPTIDSVRLLEFLRTIYGAKEALNDRPPFRPLFLASSGPAGKTALVNMFMQNLMHDRPQTPDHAGEHIEDEVHNELGAAASVSSLPKDMFMHGAYVYTHNKITLSQQLTIAELRAQIVLHLEKAGPNTYWAPGHAERAGPNSNVSSAFSVHRLARQSASPSAGANKSSLKIGPVGGLGAPCKTRRHVLWVDDLNAAGVQPRSGAQPAAELLRQLLEHGGFYAGDQNAFTELYGIATLFSGSYRDPGKWSSSLARLVGQCHVLMMPNIQGDGIVAIYKPLLLGYFNQVFGIPFPQDVRKIAENAITASMSVFTRLSTEMRPTPSRFHYVFGCNDMRAIIDGMCTITPQRCEDVPTFARLWYHEHMRTFADRMITVGDQLACCKILSETAYKFFHVNIDADTAMYGGHKLLELPVTTVGLGAMSAEAHGDFEGRGDAVDSPIIFGHFSRSAMRGYQGHYEDMHSFQAACDDIRAGIADHNSLHPEQSAGAVLFRDAVLHVSRLARVLSTPQGHAVLVGLTGFGRQTALRLAAAVISMEIVSFDLDFGSGVSLSQSHPDTSKRRKVNASVRSADTGYYNNLVSGAHAEFRDKLRAALWKAGIDNSPIAVFVPHGYVFRAGLESTDLSDQAMILDDIHHLITTLDVPSLYDEQSDAPQDLAAIIKAVRQQADRANDEESARQFAGVASSTLVADIALSLAGPEASHPQDPLVDASAQLRKAPHVGTVSATAVSGHDPAAAALLNATTISRCLSIFKTRVRQNLHVVLSLSSAGDALRQMVFQYPSLMATCWWDWYFDWKSDALVSVAQARLSIPVASASESLRSSLINSISWAATNIYMASQAIAAEYASKRGRHVYITPRVYLECLACFSSSWSTKQRKMFDNINRLEFGIATLEGTNTIVAKLKEQLTSLQPVLAAKRQEALALLDEVETQREGVAQIASKVAEEEVDVAAQADAAAELQAEAQADLEAAMPALNAATAAVEALDKAAINEMKSYSVPPPAVRTVMEAVCVLLGKDTDWDSARRVLGSDRPSFQQMLQEFDKDNISAATLKRLSRYTTSAAMTVDAVRKVSVAAASIAAWVHAVELYNNVAKEVAPKQARLVDMNSQLAQADSALAAKRKQLHDLGSKLTQLQNRSDSVSAEKDRLEKESTTAQLRLNRAHQLVAGLGAEGHRWRREAEALKASEPMIAGDTFLASAFAAYAGPFAADTRAHMCQSWASIVLALGDARSQAGTLTALPPPTIDLEPVLVSPAYSFRGAIADEVALRDWQAHGLPKDDISCDNALLATFGAGVHLSSMLQGGGGSRWPLCIDPQGQAEKWIVGMEGGIKNTIQASIAPLERGAAVGRTAVTRAATTVKTTGHTAATNVSSKSGVEVISYFHPSLTKVVEAAIRCGRPVVVKDFQEPLPSWLDTVLERRVYYNGDRAFITLQGKQIEYDDGFKLYLLSANTAPALGPEVCTKANVVDFTVLGEGLEEQLLSAVVMCERPAVEQKASQFVLSLAADKKQLAALEDTVLSLLTEQARNNGESSTTSGLHAILDDTQLVSALQTSRNMAAVISDRVAEAERNAEALLATRDLYRPVAHRAAILYSVIADLRNINCMYAYGLPYFVQLFNRSIKDSGSPALPSSTAVPSVTEQKEIETRVASIISSLTKTAFREVSRGIYAKHDAAFAFLMAANLEYDMLKRSPALDPELQLLLHGPKGTFGTLFTSTASPIEAADSLRTVIEGITQTYNLSPDCVALLLSATKEIPLLKGVTESLANDYTAWATWICTENPLNAATPICRGIGIPYASKLLLLKMLAPHRLRDAMMDYCKLILRQDYCERPRNTMVDVYMNMSPYVPGLLMISQAYDPSDDVINFAEAMGIKPTAAAAEIKHAFGALPSLAQPSTRDRLHILSLGQGQGPRAESVIMGAALRGDWVLLQNCHLSINWLPTLGRLLHDLNERPIRDLAAESAALRTPHPMTSPKFQTRGPATLHSPSSRPPSTRAGPLGSEEPDDAKGTDSHLAPPLHPDFRLFLTTAPVKGFPNSVLLSSMKWANEPPRGIRAHVSRMVQNHVMPYFLAASGVAGRTAGGEASMKLKMEKRRGSVTALPVEPQAPTQPMILLDHVHLLHALCVFHCVLQERRKFSTMGYTRDYEFTDADCEFALEIARKVVEASVKLPSLVVPKVIGNLPQPGDAPLPVKSGDIWPALLQYVCRINYGGRVVQAFDQHVIDVAFTKFCRPILELLPSSATWISLTAAASVLMSLTEQIAQDDISSDATMMGLHKNAELRALGREGKQVILQCAAATTLQAATTKAITPSLTRHMSNVRSNDKRHPRVSTELAHTDAVKRMLDNLPELLDYQKLYMKLRPPVAVQPEKGIEYSISLATQLVQTARRSDPLLAALLHECIAYNQLLSCMRATLSGALAVLDGASPMDSRSDAVLRSVANNVVPTEWLQLSFPSVDNLQLWVERLGKHLRFFAYWLRAAHANRRLMIFPIQAFVRPAALLGAVVQSYARANQLNLEEVVISAEAAPPEIPTEVAWDESAASASIPASAVPEGAVLLTGLSLEGACWGESGHLEEPEDGVLVSAAPPVLVVPTHESSRPARQSMFECPLYTSSLRQPSIGAGTGLLLSVYMPLADDASPETFALRGAALIIASEQ